MNIARCALILASLLAAPAYATGLATCDSGDPSKWKSKDELKQKLTDEGWQVRLVKEDGGCYEVYALDKDGKRTEAYFHPVTFEPIPIEGEH